MKFAPSVPDSASTVTSAARVRDVAIARPRKANATPNVERTTNRLPPIIRSMLVARSRRRFDIAIGPLEERRPVWTGRVAAAVLAPGEIAVDQRGFHRGKFRRAQILFTEQPKHRARRDRRLEAAALVHPLAFCTLPFRRAVTDERRPRRAQRDQFMRVHRQIGWLERAAVLQKISRHPMILARPGQVLDQFAEVPPMQLRAAFAG